MSNYYEALALIGKVINDNLPSNPETAGVDEAIAEALAEAGLIAPDLPAADEDGYWWAQVDWVTTIHDMVVYSIEVDYGFLAPEHTRELAHALLSAANYAELNLKERNKNGTL